MREEIEARVGGPQQPLASVKLDDLTKYLPMDEIQTLASLYDLQPALVTSIIMVESGGSHGRTRFEKGWRYPYDVAGMARRFGPTRDIQLDIELETRYQSTSWGLMQVMGSVARELGMKADLPLLVNTYTNITYGCKLLSKLQDKYPNFLDVISAYNQGNNRKEKDGSYVNQSYVDKVMGWYARLGGNHRSDD